MAKVEKKANNFSQKLGHLSVIFMHMVGSFQAVTMARSAIEDKNASILYLVDHLDQRFQKVTLRYTVSIVA